MEIMQTNMSKPLIIGCAKKRHSYIKPPIPPKPKIIPKPKCVVNLRPVGNKKCANSNSLCDSFSPKLISSVHECYVSPLSPGIETRNESLEPLEKELSSNVCTNKTIPQVIINDAEPVPSNIENSELNQSDPVDDVCSRIMENTLEECVGLGSKSCSDSSISLEDSDSDEFSLKERGYGTVSPITFSASPTIDSKLFGRESMENDDPNIVAENGENVQNRSKKSFLVAQEIKTSEESFVAVLKLLNEDFRTFLINKGCVNSSARHNEKTQRTDSIPEKELDEILKYLPNLQSLNEEILADFEVRIKNWNTHKKIADIIIKKGPFLKLYANYIRELEGHTNLLQECATRYSFFGECLREFENSELSRFLPVGKHMLTPMQRITKYKELMKQYIKYLSEDSVDYPDAVRALEIVKGVAEHANEAIKELENSARLLLLQERLNGISNADGTQAGVSVGNLQHVLVEPGRKLLKEGQLMKLCRRGFRVVYLILLSDSLLYTTQELHGAKNCPLKLRYRMPLEGMRVDIPISEDFQTEFTVISTSRSFTVKASCTKERDSWLSCLRSAIEANAIRRFSFEKAKTVEFEMLSANALGKQAPAWIPDNRVTMCQLCTAEFSLTFRRHHCRACGKVVCRYCSANRAPLAYLDNHTERVCDNCFEELQKEMMGLEGKEEELADEEEKEKFRKSLKMIRGRFKRGIKDPTRRSRMKKPERLLEVHGGDQGSQICGYLRHYSRRTWRHSWFVLKDKVMYEYRAPEDVCALSSLPILGYSVSTEFTSVDIFDGMDSSNAFQLLHSNQPPLIFCAESKDLADRWRIVMEKEVDL